MEHIKGMRKVVSIAFIINIFFGAFALQAQTVKTDLLIVGGGASGTTAGVQAARMGMRVKEVGVPRIYLDSSRAFGGVLNDGAQRLAYYRKVIQEALAVPCPEPGQDWECLGMTPPTWSSR